MAAAFLALGAVGAAVGATSGPFPRVAAQPGAGDGPVPETWALRGLSWLDPERPGPVAEVDVLVRGEAIAAIGPDLPLPPGTAVLPTPEGAVLTAGLIGVGVPLGLVEISLEASTRDLAPEGDDADPVRASFRAADGYNPRSTLIPVARMEGVTAAVVAPEGGLVAGTSAFVELAGTPAEPGVLDGVAALHVDLGDGGVHAAGGARPSALRRLRRILDDAALYRRRSRDFDARRLRELSVSPDDLARLGEALAGTLPVVVEVSRADAIVRALELAEAYGLDLVLSGAEEAHLVADRIAAAGVPVLLEPTRNLPRSFSRLASGTGNAAQLERAGVPVLIAAEGAHELRNLRQEAGNAVAAGLDRAGALAAVSSRPAAVFGQADRLGLLRTGRRANLVVWDGDPFEVTTSAVLVSIAGRPQPLRSRQSALFERYRDLDQVRRGRP
jgi:imidazolonepropionase-like amidohydrolase